MADFTYKICNGFYDYNNSGYASLFLQNPRNKDDSFMTDNHDDIFYFNENEFKIENLIEKVEKAEIDLNELKLKKFAENNQEKFLKYIRKKIYDTQDEIYIEESLLNRFMDSYYIREFINQNDLLSDYHNFILNNKNLFVIIKDKDEIRKELLYQIVNQILQQSKIKYIYIYRDMDHKSILISRI